MPIALRGTPQSGTASAAISVAVNVPAGVVNGDFLISSINSFSGTTPPSHTTPTGWTLIGSAVSPGATNNIRTSWFYRVASSEPASYTFSLSSGTYIDAEIVAYSGVDTVTPFNKTGLSNSANSTSATATDLGSTTVDGCWHVLHYSPYLHWTSSAPTGYTQDIQYDGGANTGLLVVHKLITPAGATGTAPLTASSADGWVVWAAALQPAVTTAGMVAGPINPGRTWRGRFQKSVQPTALESPTAVTAPPIAAVVTPPTNWPINRRARSRVLSGRIAVPVAGTRASIVKGIRRGPSTRPLSDGAADFYPLVVAVGATQWIQASPFNSGGLRPQQRVVARAKSPTRPVSDWGGSFPLAVLRSGAQIVQPPSTAAVTPVRPVIAMGVRRRNPTRSGYPFPQFIAPGVQPPPPGVASAVVGEQKPPKPTRSRSQLVRQPVSQAPGTPPRITAAQRRPAPKRPGSRSQIAAPFNAGGLTPEFTATAQKRTPTRPRSRVILPRQAIAVVGQAPLVVRAYRRAPLVRGLTRSRSIVRVAPLPSGGCFLWNSGIWGQDVYCVPTVTAPGLTPTLGVRREPPARTPSHLLPAARFNSGGLVPELVSGIRRRNLARSLSAPRLAATYNSGGQTPELNLARRQPLPRRAQSRLQVAVPGQAVSAGTPPEFAQGLPRRNLTRPGSRLELVARYNSGGSQPLLIRGQQKIRPSRPASRWLIAPSTPVPAKARVLRGALWAARLRVRSYSITATPSAVVPAVRPSVQRGVRRPPARSGPSHLQRWLPGPTYTSGGLQPEFTAGVKRPAAKVKPSRCLPAPRYNSGGFRSRLTQGAPRLPATRPESRGSTAGILDLGISRDVTLLLSQPFSAWSMRTAPGRWMTGQLFSAWLARLVEGNWETEPADSRWEDKPPEV